MKTKSVISNVLKIVIGLVYAVFLFLCCFSWAGSGKSGGSGEQREADKGIGLPKFIIGTPDVEFASGSFPADTQELTAVLADGEAPLLDGFTGLVSADLRGSSCYEDIAAWGLAHPEVKLLYSVPLPTGTTLDSDAESLDLTGASGEVFDQALTRLTYLPGIKTVELGSSSATPITPEQLAALRQALPEAQVNFTVDLAGQSYGLDTQSLDLSSLNHDGAAGAAGALAFLTNVTSVELGSQSDERGLSWDDIGLIQAACPQAALSYAFSLFGKSLNTSDEALDFNHITMDDEGAAVRQILPYMKNCATLDMDFCGVSNEAMASIRADFPDIKVIWRVWFGSHYSVRTDVERILASKPSKGGTIYDDTAQVLQYCTDVKYLDLGHNEVITDISFLRNMPNLEVLVIAMNPVSDFSPLASCTHLEYLEMQTTAASDLTPLSGLTELRHLNIANCKNITDISPLYGLTELERLWIGAIDPVPAEQVEAMQAAAPNCEINTTVGDDPTAGRWRVTGYTELSLQLFAETGWLQEVLHPRYELLREQFGYTDADFAFSWNDPLYEPHG